MGKDENDLPNTHVPNRNFPVSSQPIDRTSENYTRQYINQNQTTDKFYNYDVDLMNMDTAAVNKDFKSLSGNDLTPTGVYTIIIWFLFLGVK